MVGVDFFVHSDIPEFEALVLSAGKHVSTCAIDCNGANGTSVGVDLDESGGGVRRPERYRSVLMPCVKDGIVRILGESSGRSFASRELGNNLPCGRIGVPQKSAVLNTSKQKVIGQELQVCDFDVLLETVDLDSDMVIDVCMLLLGHSKVLVVVQPFGVSDQLVQM